MKTFTLAVAVAIMLTCICLQESSATEVVKLEEPVSHDNPATEYREFSVDTMPDNMQKRGIKCRVCCGCCKPGICGWCCRY